MIPLKATPSFKEKLDIVFALLTLGKDGNAPFVPRLFAAYKSCLVGTFFYSAITGLLRSKRGVSSYRRHVTLSVLRKLLSRLNSIQTQSVAALP